MDDLENGRGIQWVIDATSPDSRLRYYKMKHGSQPKSKFNVRCCDICDRIWDFNIEGDYIKFIIYQDFPRYGLDFLTCFECDPTKKFETTKSRKPIRRHNGTNIYATTGLRKTNRR